MRPIAYITYNRAGSENKRAIDDRRFVCDSTPYHADDTNGQQCPVKLHQNVCPWLLLALLLPQHAVIVHAEPGHGIAGRATLKAKQKPNAKEIFVSIDFMRLRGGLLTPVEQLQEAPGLAFTCCAAGRLPAPVGIYGSQPPIPSPQNPRRSAPPPPSILYPACWLLQCADPHVALLAATGAAASRRRCRWCDGAGGGGGSCAGGGGDKAVQHHPHPLHAVMCHKLLQCAVQQHGAVGYMSIMPRLARAQEIGVGGTGQQQGSCARGGHGTNMHAASVHQPRNTPYKALHISLEPWRALCAPSATHTCGCPSLHQCSLICPLPHLQRSPPTQPASLCQATRNHEALGSCPIHLCRGGKAGRGGGANGHSGVEGALLHACIQALRVNLVGDNAFLRCGASAAAHLDRARLILMDWRDWSCGRLCAGSHLHDGSAGRTDLAPPCTTCMPHTCERRHVMCLRASAGRCAPSIHTCTLHTHALLTDCPSTLAQVVLVKSGAALASPLAPLVTKVGTIAYHHLTRMQQISQLMCERYDHTM